MFTLCGTSTAWNELSRNCIMESTLRKRTKKSMKIGLIFGEIVLLRDSSTMWNKLKKIFGNLPDNMRIYFLDTPMKLKIQSTGCLFLNATKVIPYDFIQWLLIPRNVVIRFNLEGGYKKWVNWKIGRRAAKYEFQNTQK